MNGHLDRYIEIKTDFQGQIKRKVVCHAMVAVDDKGEVYWGATYDETQKGKEMLRKLEHMVKELKKYIKENEKKGDKHHAKEKIS